VRLLTPLDFDHRPGVQKVRNLAAMVGWALPTILSSRNPSSCCPRKGTSGAPVDIKTFDTAGGTWTKPAGAKFVQFILIGAGSGGGSGRRGAAGGVRCGGGGGGGGSRLFCELPAGEVPSTLTVAVGTGGAGGLVVSRTPPTATPARPAPPPR
jgi:hypothetical protein